MSAQKINKVNCTLKPNRNHTIAIHKKIKIKNSHPGALNLNKLRLCKSRVDPTDIYQVLTIVYTLTLSFYYHNMTHEPTSLLISKYPSTY